MGHFSCGKHFKLGDIVHAVKRPSTSSANTAAVCNTATKALDAVTYCAGSVEEEKVSLTATECQCDVDMVDADAGETSSEEILSADKDFADALGIVLARWVESAAAMPGKSDKVSHFHSTRVPSISICEYLKRIRKYFVCSDECFVTALVYIDRISKLKSSLPVCDLTVHRLLFIAVTVAAKFQDDVYYSNKYYAKVGGISLREVNALEALFLKMLDWNVCVSGAEYQLYLKLVNQAVYQPHERLRLNL